MPPIAVRAIKVTAVLESSVVAALPPPRDGEPRYKLALVAEGRRYTTDLSAKSVRRAVAAVRELGEGGCVVVLQGKLVGDTIAEAGIAAQPRSPKPASAESASEPAPAAA